MGINLKIFRIKKGLKQQELADRVGISRYYLSNLETGKANNPSNDLMIKFSAIATLLLEDREDQYIIVNLQYDLYNNMKFKDILGNMVTQNNTYLSLYSGRTYYEIRRKGFENYNIETIHDLKKKLFTTLKSYIQYYNFDEFKNEKINQIYIQLYQYTKVLIDNNEEDLLNKVFFKEISNSYHGYDKKNIEYIFTIIIYILFDRVRRISR